MGMNIKNILHYKLWESPGKESAWPILATVAGIYVMGFIFAAAPVVTTTAIVLLITGLFVYFAPKDLRREIKIVGLFLLWLALLGFTVLLISAQAPAIITWPLVAIVFFWMFFATLGLD